jgi:hypothetical protein
MTPKEKAEQLIFYYQNLLEPYLENINSLRNKSMQCALIAVDELLWEFEFALSRDKSDLFLQDKVKWFTEVKQEIENL